MTSLTVMGLSHGTTDSVPSGLCWNFFMLLHSGKYLLMGSWKQIRPCSYSIIMAVYRGSLLMLAILKIESALTFFVFSLSA